MITKKAKAKVLDQISKEVVYIDVNWSKKHPDSIKFSFGGKSFAVLKAELFQILFAVSTPEQQDLMIPVKKELVRPYARKHMVKLLHDMKAGETLNVHCEVNVPLILEEAMKRKLEGLDKQKEKEQD